MRCLHGFNVMAVDGLSVQKDRSRKSILFFLSITWSDEAQYHLSRLPPYLEVLVRDEVETFCGDRHYGIVTHSRMVTARNKGQVEWSPDAERRLANVPSGIRTMAKTELERTALDRGMPEVTVALMEEVKTRYFGMATGRS